MKIQIKNCKESPELMDIHVNLYNNGGENLRIDTEKYQFVLHDISEWHAKRMIFQIEQYIKDRNNFKTISEMRMLSRYEIKELFLEYTEKEILLNNKGLYEEVKKYEKLCDEMVEAFEFLPI